jgi:hypothetical protein
MVAYTDALGSWPVTLDRFDDLAGLFRTGMAGDC